MGEEAEARRGLLDSQRVRSISAVKASSKGPYAVKMVLGIGAYGCEQDRRGEADASLSHERKQQEAADAARKEVDRLRGGADRSRVKQFDRD